MSDVKLVDFTSEDISIVENWARAAHVVKWWGHDGLSEEFNSVFVQKAIIEANGKKVGLIVWFHPSRQELDEAGLKEISTTAMDIDLMIGEIDFIGKGIGAKALRLAIIQIFQNPLVPYVVGAAMKGNIASIRTGQKLGFEKIREFEDPELGSCFLGIKYRDEN